MIMAGSGKISIKSLPAQTQEAIRSTLQCKLPCTREHLTFSLLAGMDLEDIPIEIRPDLDYYLPPEVNFPDDLDMETL